MNPTLLLCKIQQKIVFSYIPTLVITCTSVVKLKNEPIYNFIIIYVSCL